MHPQVAMHGNDPIKSRRRWHALGARFSKMPGYRFCALDWHSIFCPEKPEFRYADEQLKMQLWLCASLTGTALSAPFVFPGPSSPATSTKT